MNKILYNYLFLNFLKTFFLITIMINSVIAVAAQDLQTVTSNGKSTTDNVNIGNLFFSSIVLT